MKKKLLIAISIIATLAICLTLAGCSTQNTDLNTIHNNTADTGQIFIYQEIISKTKTTTVCIYASNVKGSRTSSGSGFIISNNGYVVTNQHVVKGYRYFEVVVIDKDNKTYSYDATLFVSNATPDIAVLKISSSKEFDPIKFGKSAGLSYGDPCVMIGNPKGVGFMSARAMVASPSVTISGVKYVAIDAPVNPGNSGGALINANCEVIGVITSRYTTTGSVNDVVMDMGFAQKTEDVMKYLLKNPTLAKILDYWS